MAYRLTTGAVTVGTAVRLLARPGVHNWIDTCGRGQVLMLYRWQGLSPRQVHAGPVIEPPRIVKLAELDAVLHKGCARIDAAGRRAQPERRAVAFRRRIAPA
ncbi:hypothetical protein [Streptomyces sp. NPDC058280]|uniref:hypothetical protein n=1 Tax=Streptomyces sp. NPDC058280 TaxID=3346419 RepID=UPI0036EF0C07